MRRVNYDVFIFGDVTVGTYGEIQRFIADTQGNILQRVWRRQINTRYIKWNQTDSTTCLDLGVCVTKINVDLDI